MRKYVLIIALLLVACFGFGGCVSTTGGAGGTGVIASINSSDNVTAVTSGSTATFLVKIDETLVAPATVVALIDGVAGAFGENLDLYYDSTQNGYVLSTNNTGIIDAIKLIHGVTGVVQTGQLTPLLVKRPAKRVKNVPPLK